MIVSRCCKAYVSVVHCVEHDYYVCYACWRPCDTIFYNGIDKGLGDDDFGDVAKVAKIVNKA